MEKSRLEELFKKIQADHAKTLKDEANAMSLKLKLEGAAEILGLLIQEYKEEPKAE